jgi:hypothetical protein
MDWKPEDMEAAYDFAIDLRETLPAVPKDHFRCFSCHQVYAKAWSDEKAVEEAIQYFGSQALEDAVIVCEDCFAKLMRQ